jgi:DNA replication protein DnaC
VFVEEAERAIRNAPNPDNACPPYGFRSQWLNWPETANIWKRRPLEINLDVEHVKLVDRLFLDDIGGEVIKGCDDFSLGILREIVDYRYRHSMRTWWTSNLSPNELNDVYGARLASRLTSTWKPYEIEGIDLRIAK